MTLLFSGAEGILPRVDDEAVEPGAPGSVAVGEADPSASLRDDNKGESVDCVPAGGMTASRLAMSRPMTLRSARWLLMTVVTMWVRRASARSMSPSRSMKATSGSIIQNSVRWRRVFDFSARQEGPQRDREST